MKFRKLVICMVTGIMGFCTLSISTYARQENPVIKEEVVITKKAVVSKESVNTKKDNLMELTSSKDSAVQETNVQETISRGNNSDNGLINEEQAEEEAKAKAKAEAKEEAEAEAKAKEEAEAEAEAEAKAKAEEEATEENNATETDLRLLSTLIYCESSGESYQGKLAVGIVVMNRTQSNSFPSTVKGVIYQSSQFSPVANGSLDKALTEYDNGTFTSSTEKDCIKAAEAALNGTKSITVNGESKNFSKYLYFGVSVSGYTFLLGNHQFK